MKRLIKRLLNEGFKEKGEYPKLTLRETIEQFNTLFTLTEQEIEVGNTLERKLKTINSPLSNKMLNFFKSGGIKDTAAVDYVDYNKDNEKLLTLGYKDRMGNIKKRLYKINSLLSYLGADVSDIASHEIEDLINHLKKADTTSLKIVDGEDIPWAYHCGNNEDGVDMGSCMAKASAQSYFEMYIENPEQVKCIVLTNPETGKIRGRALLWQTDGGQTVMDRVYTVNKEYTVAFNNYAEANGIKQIYGTSSRMSVTLSKGGRYDSYPYIDTFMNYTPDTGVLSTTEGEFVLQDTQGGGDNDNRSYSEYYQEWIDEDDAYYVEHMDDYFYGDDIINSWDDERLFIDSDEVVRIDRGDHRDEYALESEVVTDYKGNTILAQDAMEIYHGEHEGEYALDSEFIEIEIGPGAGEDALKTDVTKHFRTGEIMLSDSAIQIEDGEFEGSYAVEEDFVETFDGSMILYDEAVEVTAGSLEGVIAAKEDCYVITGNDMEDLIFHEDNVGEFQGVSYTPIREL